MIEEEQESAIETEQESVIEEEKESTIETEHKSLIEKEQESAFKEAQEVQQPQNKLARKMKKARKQDQNTTEPTQLYTKLDKADIHKLAFELEDLNQEEEEEEEEEKVFF